MAGAIGPGDWLEALRDEDWAGASIVAGALYCVSSTGDEGTCLICADAGPGFQLVGVSPRFGSWCPCGFRLIGPDEERSAPPVRICEAA